VRDECLNSSLAVSCLIEDKAAFIVYPDEDYSELTFFLKEPKGEELTKLRDSVELPQ
jgi:hypothetical protein